MRGPRLFNRFELKYLIDLPTVAALRREFQARMAPDSFAGDGPYAVWSCYYDSPGLMCYWEKTEGFSFRRKLRLRHYGAPHLLDLDTPCWMEIKQRIDRVTQKRRTLLPYRDALEVAAGRDPASVAPGDERLVEEVQHFSITRRLQPIAVVGYLREAFEGRDEDAGTRCTFDVRIRARDRDLGLHVEGVNQLIVPADLAILEIKLNEFAPYWIVDLVARHNLQLIRISKYCQSIEAFDLRPRSAYHLEEPQEESSETYA